MQEREMVAIGLGDYINYDKDTTDWLLEMVEAESDKAIILLRGTAQDKQKMIRRRYELTRSPGLRLIVDTTRLKDIVDYDRFLCHPTCSIARGDAIKESDIDCGLVITNQGVTLAKQIAFLNELKRQGFRVRHLNEMNDVFDTDEIVRFVTVEELEWIRTEKGWWIKEWLISLAGFEIK